MQNKLFSFGIISLCSLLISAPLSLAATGEVSVATATTTNTTDEVFVNGPQIEKVETVNKTHLKVMFNEGIVLPDQNPETVFTITLYDNQNEFLDVLTAEIDPQDSALKTVILTTAEQQANTNYIITAGVNITNLAGNPVVSGVFDTGFFFGSELLAENTQTNTGTTTVATTNTGTTASTDSTPDITPPEEITDLVITQKLLELNEYLVTLTWAPSLNSAEDLVDQIIYKSLNRGTSYDNGTSLGPNATKYETRLEGGKEYTFKITTKDRSGNESTGVIKSIRLPQTGPALGLFALAVSGLGAGKILRRKK